MINEFKKISGQEETRYVLESGTTGGTGTGALGGSIAMPMGGIQRRKGDNLLTPESDTPLKPRRGPLKPQTGGGKHKDKTKTIPRKAKHKTPVAEIYQKKTAGEKLAKRVDKYKKDAETDVENQRRQQALKGIGDRMKAKSVAESIRGGEYYIWTVHFADPEKNPPRRVRVYSDEFMIEIPNIEQFYAKKGLKVVDVDTDTGIRSEPRVKPEPYEPGGSAHKDTSATDRAIGNFDRQVPESIPGGTDTMNFMANAGIPKDEIGYAIMLLRKKQNNKTMNAREQADWAGYEKKLRVMLMMRKGQSVAEETGKSLSVDQLATISDAALDSAYHYGRSQPGNTFGWQANLKSAAFAKQMIDRGVTDIEQISDAIHKGWNMTAQAFVKNPMQFDDSKTMAPEKLQAKIAQRQKLMTQNYAQLPEDEKEKDRVVARAMLQAITGGQQGVAEGWSEKYKRSINCSHPKGFSQKAHCTGKRKHNEDFSMEMTCPDCGMCETHGNHMLEVKQRLDAKCWKGKHKEGTKIKGGIRVNNCVPNEGMMEGEVTPGFTQGMSLGKFYLRHTPIPNTWYDTELRKDGKYIGKASLFLDDGRGLTKHKPHLILLIKNPDPKIQVNEYNVSDPNDPLLQQAIQSVTLMRQQDVAEGEYDNSFIGDENAYKELIDFANEQMQKGKSLDAVVRYLVDNNWLFRHEAEDFVKTVRGQQGVAEGDEYNEYSDEVDMVENNLLTIIRACKELADTLKSGENLPEWVEEKISMSKQNMVTVSEYLQSQHDQGHIYETMMPASMFAGSNKNKLGVAGQWRNKGPKKNKPAKAGDLVGGDESIQFEASDAYHQRLQWNLEAAIDERSVSQAQARMMAAAAHDPAFAKKVGIKTNVAKEFNRADTGKDISKLPKHVLTKKKK
jgi:hypothetical protein